MGSLGVVSALVLLSCGLLISVSAIPAIQGSELDYTETTCLDSDLSLSCDDGVIFVKSARFGWRSTRLCGPGRPHFETDPARCLREIPIIPKWCNGQATCMINKEKIGRPHRCFFTHYTTTYICIPAKTIEICEDERGLLRCGNGRIKVIAANYGRTDGTTCLRRPPFRRRLNTNCYSQNTLDLVSQRCDGRRRCSLTATNDVFSDPCAGTRKYLKITYYCQS
ncbi:Gal_Lectin domain-containing protein precursor [Danio rerio]|uniref:DEAD (Asp-Glu-Ala-Asp) box polypeptide 41 n=1 Tax=Danio rerio TaxID=7955 RepID=E9QFV1_DANRE|nr:Gal_Lectin domain-containing protein precursor [Danio rerio]|eukprot:NP_001315125.1 L-rhamnose-binding lectin-like precursor [Danio rerio]